MANPVFINRISAYLPFDPVDNEQMEERLGLVGGQPSRARRHRVPLLGGGAIATAFGLALGAGATALVLVDANPGITQAELARYFGNGRTTMHGIVQELLGAGLLDGQAKVERGQALALHVTPKGKAAVSFELEAIDAQFEFCCEVIGRAPTVQLMDHLQTLCAAAEAIRAAPMLTITGQEP